MKIIALEPYYGGSHQAFLDGWISLSRHQWTLHTLPATKWKYRMRHAAINFAHSLNQESDAKSDYNLVFCSDMLNLAEFKGLVKEPIRSLPSVIYFHENQLTYPVQHYQERDFHFSFTNLTSALAATEVWFNSKFHRASFLQALPLFLKRLPDHQPLQVLSSLPDKGRLAYPGIKPVPPRRELRASGPLHILWVARWEHDKNPEDFFAALEQLKKAGVDFRLSVLGESFDEAPDIFEASRQSLADHLLNFGYRATREEYIEVLHSADVVVSTANHEFFGLAIIEAVAAGAWPLLPNRLSYPEILASDDCSINDRCYYDGSVKALVRKLIQLASQFERGELPSQAQAELRKLAERYFWPRLVSEYDDRLEAMVQG